MKFSKFIIPGICISVIAISGSCAKKDKSPLGLGGCGYTWSLEIADESIALSQAASAFASDSSNANCLKYKKAYQDYLDEAEDIKSCVPAADKDDFQKSIDDARDELNDLPC